MQSLFYPKLVHELNKRVSNKQDIRFFVFAVGHKPIVLQKENVKDVYIFLLQYQPLHNIRTYCKTNFLKPCVFFKNQHGMFILIFW